MNLNFFLKKKKKGCVEYFQLISSWDISILFITLSLCIFNEYPYIFYKVWNINVDLTNKVQKYEIEFIFFFLLFVAHLRCDDILPSRFLGVLRISLPLLRCEPAGDCKERKQVYNPAGIMQRAGKRSADSKITLATGCPSGLRVDRKRKGERRCTFRPISRGTRPYFRLPQSRLLRESREHRNRAVGSSGLVSKMDAA